MLNILKKLSTLFLVAFLSGLGFSIMVGAFSYLCSLLGQWGNPINSFLGGMLGGYISGILIGSTWFLIKEAKKK